MIERNRVVRRRTELAYDLRGACGIERGGERHLAQELRVDGVRTGESKDKGPRCRAAEGEEKHVLVRTRRALRVTRAPGQGRRVDDDEVVTAGILANEAERVGLEECRFRSMGSRCDVLPGKRERLRGRFDDRERRRAGPPRRDRKSSRISKEIEHPAPSGERLDKIPG